MSQQKSRESAGGSGAKPTPAVVSPPKRRVASALRRVAADLYHLPDRLRHKGRREQARQAVAQVAEVRSAIFICYGNVCRSPYAAAVFARGFHELMGHPAIVTSAGFIGPGRTPPDAALRVAARRGYDLSAHRSMLIPVLDSADLIVVMSADQAEGIRRTYPGSGAIIVLGDLDPLAIRRRTIRDPWGNDDSVFDESYERIDRCVEEILRILKRSARGGRVR